ncbi:hypothetical protein M9458_039649, partial [Cirrhinus mrigala]
RTAFTTKVKTTCLDNMMAVSYINDQGGFSFEAPLYSGRAPLGMGSAQFAFAEINACAGQAEPRANMLSRSKVPLEEVQVIWGFFGKAETTLIAQVIRRIMDQKHKVLNQHWFAELSWLLSAVLWPIPLRRINRPPCGLCTCGLSMGACKPPQEHPEYILSG